MKCHYIHVVIIAALGIVMFLPGAPMAGEYYFAGHGGKLLLTNDAQEEINEDQFVGGFLFGKELADYKQAILALEADLFLPLNEGTTAQDFEWRLWTAGLYATLRGDIREPAYGKVRVGVVYQDFSVEKPNRLNNEDFGLSAGVGLGAYLSKRLFLEIDATGTDKNVGNLRTIVGFHL